MEEYTYSSNSELQEAIEYLLSIGLPPLPVAPYQSYPVNEKGEPIFTGKNPSYLDKSGKAHPVAHSNYREKLPNKEELKEWFANPANGIGTLGGINNIVFIDVDLKHFDSKEDLEKKMTAWGDKYIPDRKSKQKYWIESTQSGGFRIAARVKELPDFKNFSFEPQGNHVGEILGSTSFTVLAPTVGLYGEYKNHGRDKILEVDSLDSVDIHPVKKQKDTKSIQSHKPKKQNPSSENDPNAISLRSFISNSNQEILKGNIETDDRSNSLTTLINDLHGCSNWFCDNNIPYKGDAEELAYEAGEALGIDEDRIGRIYDDIPEIGLTPAALYGGGEKSCWKKIRKLNREIYKAKCPKEMKLEIEQEMEEYINNQNCRSVEVDVEPDTSLKPSNNENCRSVELVEANLEEFEEINSILDESDQSEIQDLDLSDYLPKQLANSLKQVAEAIPTSPAMLLTTLLSVCASLVGTAAEVEPWDGWKEPSIIWSMLVAPTGSKKSPAMKVITKPLWNLDNQTEGRDYIVDDFTMEALIQVHSENPRGLLACRDELDGLFASQNQYRQGKGDDSQKWLTLYNGESNKVDRKGDNTKIRLSKTAVSITGTIQPKVLQKHLTEDKTHSGFNARWLYCCPEMPSGRYTGKKCPDVSSQLSTLYSNLEKVQDGSIFRFSEEAKDYFVDDWYDTIADKLDQEYNSPFIQSVLGKMQGQCARIALILHCIEEISRMSNINSEDEIEIAKEIPLEIVKRAILLSSYYLDQAKLVSGITDEPETSFPRVWVRLKDISIRKGGWITARDASQQTNLVGNTEKARVTFWNMAKANFGEISGEGKGLKWRHPESI